MVDPFPDLLCELLHKELPWATIVPVPRLWNVLAAAFIDCHTGLATAQTVTERYCEVEWTFGSSGPPRRERPTPRHRRMPHLVTGCARGSSDGGLTQKR